MKIAIFLNESFFNEGMGGGTSYNLAILDAISKLTISHEFVFITASSSKDRFGDTFKGKPVIYFDVEYLNINYSFLDKVINKLLPNSLFIKTLRQRIELDNKEKSTSQTEQNFIQKVKENQIDLVYYTNPMSCISPEVPYFTTFWDLGHLTVSLFPEVASNGEFDQRESWYKYYLKRATGIIVESDAGKKDLEKYYQIPSDKMHVLYQFPGNVVTEQVPLHEQAEYLSKNNLTKYEFLLYPAQFWPHKNHFNLIKALDIVRQTLGKEIPIVFTGSDKGNLTFINNCIQDMNLENVHYLGLVELKHLYILYKNALALIMPTFLGPTNMPIIEALYLSCPIICSDLEGHREIAQEAALYIQPNSPQDIADKILMLYQQEAARHDLILKSTQVLQKTKFKTETIEKTLFSAFDQVEKMRTCW